MRDVEHIHGDWSTEHGQPSGGAASDSTCRLCGSPINRSPTRATAGALDRTLTFRSGLAFPWLRGQLTLASRRVVGNVPRSFLGIPVGRVPIDVSLDDLEDDLIVDRTRETALEWLPDFEEIGFALMALILAPVIALVVLVWANLGQVAGWVTLVVSAAFVIAVAALHGWTLSGLTRKPMRISWSDRADARHFAAAVNAARAIGTNPTSPPW